MNSRTRDMCFIAIMTALICIAGPNTIPIGAVPLTLANFTIYLTGALLGRKKGTIAVILYLLLGIVGLPVFSGYSSGIAKLAGPTGGFLLGDIPCVFLIGMATDLFHDRKWMLPVMMVAGTAVLYALGVAWFVISGNALGTALTACVVPFILPDAMKIAAATVIALAVRKPIDRLMGRAA